MNLKCQGKVVLGKVGFLFTYLAFNALGIIITSIIQRN